VASQSRKHRGMRSQRVVADWFQRHGWPFSESTGAGRSGSDITGMPGLAPEVKARSDLQPIAWLKQAEANAGLPFVVFRPNGMGEQAVGKWGVMCRLEVFTDLLRASGYGTPSETNDRPEGSDEEANNDDRLNAVLGLPADLTTRHGANIPPEAAS
jgi:hypothetical protein